MTNLALRQQALDDALATRILVLDGAMGTMLQARHLTAADFGGASLEGCNEYLVKTRPDVIEDIHRAYLAAGSDIIETNTFGGTALVLAEYGVEDEAYDLNLRAANSPARPPTTSPRPTNPASSPAPSGPPPKPSPSPAASLSRSWSRISHDQAKALVDGGVDIFLVETSQDTRNVKAALLGIAVNWNAKPAAKFPSWSPAPSSRWAPCSPARTPKRFFASVAHADLLSIGLNCATGPGVHDGPHPQPVRNGHRRASPAIPTRACPTKTASISKRPQSLAAQLERFAKNGWLNIVGGCCGTTDKHIAAIAKMVEGRKPREIKPARTALTIPASNSSRPKTATGRSSSASAPTSSVRARSRT